MITTPFWLWIALIALGTLGSLGTLVAITVTFLRERREGHLW
ncbi:hypothetical protein [Pseudonocardia nigra]|nr:hypothetical protein [Pseudonocardia nigra]